MSAEKLWKMVLQAKGVHWVVTRIGPNRLRSRSFDEKYRSGSWNFAADSQDLALLINRLSHGGDILALGCGTCAVITELPSGAFASFTGVDLSTEAITRARQHNVPGSRFEVADMGSYNPDRQYDVILFSDSFNYVPGHNREKLLRRLSHALKSDGRIVVTIAQPNRYAGIISMIHERFSVDVDASLDGSERRVLVFR